VDLGFSDDQIALRESFAGFFSKVAVTDVFRWADSLTVRS
jgi:hypothetical protein